MPVTLSVAERPGRAWEAVRFARHPDRPHALDCIRALCGERFEPLGGDRAYRRDPAIVSGIGWLDRLPIMLIGQEKGRSFGEREQRNFGMVHPEGYRSARRLIGVAERFGLPIVALVDTPGAYPGLGAEQRGQSEAIAGNLERLLGARVPVVTVILGEGGSGGALALGLSDVTLMLEHAIYAVISPEGCASILWGDAAKAEAAAEALRLTSPDLLAFGVVDEIIAEPTGGAQADAPAVIASLREAIVRHLGLLMPLGPETLLHRRATKYSRMGRFRKAPSHTRRPLAEDRGVAELPLPLSAGANVS